MNKCVDVYLQKEFYNPRVKAKIPGAWIAEFENGQSLPICGEYEVSSKEEAIQYLCERMEN